MKNSTEQITSQTPTPLVDLNSQTNQQAENSSHTTRRPDSFQVAQGESVYIEANDGLFEDWDECPRIPVEVRSVSGLDGNTTIGIIKF